ncbi:MAG TPA: redoxin domain-containing protein [Chryseosolibacter sp.]|nr:redoxin domain-containing protein [Chryseosolibacter sp.]
MKTNLFIALLVFTFTSAESQTGSHSYPVVGEPCPDFTLSGINDYSLNKISRNDLAGKFYILDFWSKYCSACAASFPRTNTLYGKFKDRLLMLLVGVEDKEERMRPMYEKIRSRIDLNIPYTFDSVVFRKFVHRTVPHLIWVDNEGIIKAITSSTELTEENIERFLAKKDFPYVDRSYSGTQNIAKAIPLDYKKPFLFNGNGGALNESFSGSILVAYTPGEMRFAGLPFDFKSLARANVPAGNMMGCGGLKDLYRFAYVGRSSWYPEDSLYYDVTLETILEVTDPSMFMTDQVTGAGIYCYSLKLPSDTYCPKKMMIAMQQDLGRTFPYVASLQKREVACWRLSATDKARRNLKSKGGSNLNDHTEPAEIKLTNVSMTHLISSVFNKHIQNNRPFFDDTGIGYNVDLFLEANVNDIEDLRRALEEQGLLLTESTEEMFALVIKDK